MNSLQAEMIRLLKVLEQDTSSTAEYLSIWSLAFVVGVLTIVVIGKGMRSAMAYSYPRALVIGSIFFASILSGMAAINLYLLPRISNPNIEKTVSVIILLGIILVVVAPVCRWLHKTKYSSALFTVSIALISSIVAIFIVRSGFNAARTGKASAVKSKAQTESVSNIIHQKTK